MFYKKVTSKIREKFSSFLQKRCTAYLTAYLNLCLHTFLGIRQQILIWNHASFLRHINDR